MIEHGPAFTAGPLFRVNRRPKLPPLDAENRVRANGTDHSVEAGQALIGVRRRS